MATASDALNRDMQAEYYDASRALEARALEEWREEARHAEHVRLVDSDKHAVLVDGVLASRFHPEVYEQLRRELRINLTTNILQEVCGKSLREFSAGLGVDMVGPVADEPVPGFAEMADVVELEDLAKDIKRPHFLHSRVCVMPQLCGREREFEWVILTPESFLCTHVDGEMVALTVVDRIHGARGEDIERFTVWTAQQISVFHMQNGKHVLVSQQPNPYGAIPTHVFKGQDNERRLAELAVLESSWLTYQQLSGRLQLKMLAGEFGEKFQSGQRQYPGAVISLGDVENVNVLDFQTNMQAFDDIMVSRPRMRACIHAGLPPDDLDGGAAVTSGEQIRMRYLDRDEKVLERQHTLVGVLHECWELAWSFLYVEASRAGVADDGTVVTLPPVDGLLVEGGTTVLPPGEPFSDEVPAGMPDPEEYHLRLNPAEPPLTETEAERETRITYNVTNGYQSRIEAMMERDPDLDAETAQARLLANLKMEQDIKNAYKLGEMVRKLPSAGNE